MFWPSNPKHGVLFSCFILLLDFPWVVFAGICPSIQFFLEPSGSGSHQSLRLSMRGTFWSGKGLRAGLKAYQQMVLGWDVTGLSLKENKGKTKTGPTKWGNKKQLNNWLMWTFCRLKLEVEVFIETFELEYFFSYLDKGGGWRFEGKMGGEVFSPD